ncbi:hypothetical protein [Lentzea sp. NPDC003310]|uniref:hypothetical protein n=1 Tax=Lentzea sp. NPDC003310 TaxID=3154447 RepID=UPI0033B5520E
MSKFEDNLWLQLERDHGPELTKNSLAKRRSNAARWLSAAAAAVVVITGAVVAPAHFGGTPPADSLPGVEPDSVTLTLKDLGKYEQVNAMLREQGIAAVMVPLRQDCTDTVPQLDGGPTGTIPWGGGSDITRLVIVPSRIQPGATLVFATSPNDFGSLVSGFYAPDRLPTCLRFP